MSLFSASCILFILLTVVTSSLAIEEYDELKLLKGNPEFEPNEVNNFIRYSLGKRVPHDQLVGHTAGAKRWPKIHNFSVVLKYPTKGTGAIISFAEIIVSQSSDEGDARVLAGGVNQRTLAVRIEANNTLYFEYSASVYGTCK